jgi:predicted nucleotidyltransferase component of viral defense system
MAKTKPDSSNIFTTIKSIALKALFSDDELLDMLVLKGGNALTLIYKLINRASIDLDFSIQEKIKEQDFERIKERINKTLVNNFDENGYKVIDFDFRERPREANTKRPDFWGGYRIEFKVIEKSLYNQFNKDIEALRRNAAIIASGQQRIFSIDISKYEYCITKERHEFEGLTIYVYSPEMIVFEKLRAICQQMEEYLQSVNANMKNSSERARDFFDIYNIVNILGIEVVKEDSLEIFTNIFGMKQVQIGLLGKIGDTREFHKIGYSSLKDTVAPGDNLLVFDSYFDFVVDLGIKLKVLWDNKYATPQKNQGL